MFHLFTSYGDGAHIAADTLEFMSSNSIVIIIIIIIIVIIIIIFRCELCLHTLFPPHNVFYI